MKPGERFNIVSHLFGALLAAVGLLVLVLPPLRDGELTKAIGFTVYGTGLIVTFLVSTLYHLFRGDIRDFLRRCDRIAIYLLIAGTYTPVTLLRLPSVWGGPLLAAVWALALGGAVLEWRAARDRTPHSVALYIVMGWMGLLAVRPLLITLSISGVAYLLAGGLFYTAGAAVVRLTAIPRRHEIWHVAVLAGSGCHFLMMVLYVR